MLSEFTRILRTLWTEGAATFQGEYFQFNDARCLPKPSGNIDLVWAGSSSRGRRFVAEYADYHFGAGSTPESVQLSNAALDQACEVTGRRPTAIANATLVIADTDQEAERGVA